VNALTVWLRTRERVMRNADADEGWLFINEYGGRVDEGRWRAATKSYLKWANLSPKITPHSLRRFGLNKYATVNLLAAQQIAGHKDARTTQIYLKLDPEHLNYSRS